MSTIKYSDWSHKDTINLILLHKKGASKSELENFFGLSYEYLRRKMREIGLEPKRPGTKTTEFKWTKEKKEKLVEMYKEKTPVTKILDHFGCSARQMYLILDEYGIKKRYNT